MRVKLLEKMEEMGYEPLVYSRDTVWVSVKSEIRKKAHEKAMRHKRIMRSAPLGWGVFVFYITL